MDVRVIFIRDTDSRQGGEFKAGQVEEMSAASARHWVNRRVAEYVDADETPREQPKAVIKTEEQRAEVVDAMAGQIEEIANAQLDGSTDVDGQDGAAAGDGAESEPAAAPAVPSGAPARAGKGGGGRRQ